ncbi:hypothetical protein [Vibrio sp. CK2-1]|uniref:hypothetical protein n=1 Tax=Vibrio sp. CK2-1 TaxID=2912249 RepID=UPI001F372397|nr:hypothetical protein [Vibrio sp. CK2-1]MCF7353294.1 hypothetical protein [Vibrio sp. CK2-1]
MKITNLHSSFFLYSSSIFLYLASGNIALANLDLAKSELSPKDELITEATQTKYNVSYINISGESNIAYIKQSSDFDAGNTASITQKGNDNKSFINQGGDANSASIDQYGNSNLAIIMQSGSGNTGSIIQDGNENEAILSQSGVSLEGSISQSGNGNLAYIVDRGNVSMSGYDINQSGQSSLIIINGMNRNINMTLK